MESIVSPWLFYFARIADMVTITSGIIAIFSGIVAIISIIIALIEDYDGVINDEQTKNYRMAIKIFKKALVLTIICTLLAVFVPDKPTVYKMYLADKVTYDVVQQSIDITKDTKNELKQGLIDIINELQEDH